jgi:ribulose 1,5-bisphosphate synthetase/thiazole synthase
VVLDAFRVVSALKTVSYSKQVPVRYAADVAVIGGGIAGVCAACAAAESGVTVVLVERFATLGGMMTVGGVNNFCGETAGQGRVFDELISGLEGFGQLDAYKPYEHFEVRRRFHHEALALVIQEALLKRGVKLLLHTRFVDVAASDNGRIGAVLLRGQSGPEALEAKQFIDATGEGELAHLAGFATMKGRASDGLTLPMSLMYFVRELEGQVVPQIPKDMVEPIESKADLPMTSPWFNGPASKAIKIKVPGFDSTDTESLTEAEIAARRKMMQVIDFHQREGKPWYFDHVSPIIGIREGRRIVGDYVLTEDDVRAGRSFDDGVAVGTFYIDAHSPTTDKHNPQVADKDARRVPPYHIPLRSLRAKDSHNLWMAGRDLSAENLAMASARVAPTGAMMGQAVGVAAAMAAGQGTSASDVDAGEVRRIVVERGANLELGGRPTSLNSRSEETLL